MNLLMLQNNDYLSYYLLVTLNEDLLLAYIEIQVKLLIYICIDDKRIVKRLSTTTEILSKNPINFKKL